MKILGLRNNSWIQLDKENILKDFELSYAYEVIRLLESRPLFLDLHYERLIKTCNSLNIEPPQKAKIIEDITNLVKISRIQNTNIKIAIDKNHYAIYPIVSRYPTKENYLRGVSCSLLFEERESPEIKAYQSELREKANEQISALDIYESILVNKDGLMTEGSRSNLFFIKGNEIFTAPDQLVLAGITRLKVLELIKELNLTIKFEAVSKNELFQIGAAFICGTSPGVLPLANIENFKLNVENSILLKIHRLYHSRYLSD